MVRCRHDDRVDVLPVEELPIVVVDAGTMLAAVALRDAARCRLPTRAVHVTDGDEPRFGLGEVGTQVMVHAAAATADEADTHGLTRQRSGAKRADADGRGRESRRHEPAEELPSRVPSSDTSDTSVTSVTSVAVVAVGAVLSIHQALLPEREPMVREAAEHLDPLDPRVPG
jgi:hypothetical protein